MSELNIKPTLKNWHTRIPKLRLPYRFERVDYGYWNKLKPSKLIVKRCSCKLVNMPIAKRVRVEVTHLDLWRD